MTLEARIAALATRIGNYLRDSILTRVIPTGGTTGQSLVKSSNADFIVGWGSPAAGAAGTDRQIQYNNAGALAGTSNYYINASNNVVVSYASASTTPPADSVEQNFQRLLAGAGRVLPRWRGEDGIYSTMQAHIARNSVYLCMPQGYGSSVLTNFGGLPLSNMSVATGKAMTFTNRFTRSKRVSYVTAATAGAINGLYNGAQGNAAVCTLGGAAGAGFFSIQRWGVADAALVATAHMFIGFRNLTAAPVATTNPNTFTNSIGVAQIAGSANLQIVYGGTVAQAPIDLGANFPAGGLSTDEYELMLYARPDQNNTVAYRLERINTGHVATGILTGVAGTALPANNVTLGMQMWRSNNTTALAAALDFIVAYIETDL